jgi:hypothetical protein
MCMFYQIREATYGVSKDRGFETIIPGTKYSIAEYVTVFFYMSFRAYMKKCFICLSIELHFVQYVQLFKIESKFFIF